MRISVTGEKTEHTAAPQTPAQSSAAAETHAAKVAPSGHQKLPVSASGHPQTMLTFSILAETKTSPDGHVQVLAGIRHHHSKTDLVTVAVGKQTVQFTQITDHGKRTELVGSVEEKDRKIQKKVRDAVDAAVNKRDYKPVEQLAHDMVHTVQHASDDMKKGRPRV